MAVVWKKLAREDAVITKALLTAEGDVIYASGASTPARLGIGAEDRVLTSKSGVPSWEVAVGGGGLAIFGDGSDGNVTTAGGGAGDVTLTRDMFYNNLTVTAGDTVTTAGYRIFVKGTLTNNGTIERNGNNGSPGTAGAALAAGSLGGSAAGGAKNYAGGGGGGGGVMYIAAKILINTGGVIQANGGDGGDAITGGTDVKGLNGSNGHIGGDGGNGGEGHRPGLGGTSSTTATSQGRRALPWAAILRDIPDAANPILLTGGSGGGGGGRDGSNNNGGGGGGGGGYVVLVYNSLSAGTEEANGGAGGSEFGSGAGDGVAGSNGTVVKIANA